MWEPGSVEHEVIGPRASWLLARISLSKKRAYGDPGPRVAPGFRGATRRSATHDYPRTAVISDRECCHLIRHFHRIVRRCDLDLEGHDSIHGHHEHNRGRVAGRPRASDRRAALRAGGLKRG